MSVILGTKSIFLDSSFANNGFCFSISILFHDGCPLIKLLPFKQYITDEEIYVCEEKHTHTHINM